MENFQEVDRRPFPVDSTSHPISQVDDIAFENSEGLREAVESAQILWFTVSCAHHLESSATGPTDYKDDLGAESNKRLLFLLFQAAKTYTVEVMTETPNQDPDEDPQPPKVESVDLPEYTSITIDDEEHFRPSRQVFIEQLFAISDPKQKIGYRYAFCLFSKQCTWTDLLFQAVRNNERRAFSRTRARPQERLMNPNLEVSNMERFATLICDYLGNSEGLYHKISGSLRATATLNSMGNRANPLRVFSFNHSCKKLERFNTGNGTVSLSTLNQDEHPLVCQALRNEYVRVGMENRTFNVAIVFPKPNAVWAIDSRFWSFEALYGVLLPGFESSEMVELANEMRKCRISVADSSGRLGSDIASELLTISSSEHRDGEHSEILTAAVVHDDSKSASDAVFGAFSRIDISSLSAKEQFKLTSVITRIREENKNVVQEFRRGNWTTEQFNEKYVSYRKNAVRIFERDVMVKNNKYLSRPERSVVNSFLDYVVDRAKQNAIFVDEDFMMPVTDPSLSPAANYIKALMDEKENNGMSNFHVADLILWTGVNDSWRYSTGMHMNFALTGKHGAGKSYLQSRILARSNSGVCTNVMHETSKAAMTSGNRNGEINLLEELPEWMFGNSDGQGAETGDPTLKARLTQAIISVVYFHHNKETGERERKIIYAMSMSSTCAATNEEWDQMPAALRDRFWHITAPKFKRIGSTPADRISIGDIRAFCFNDDIENRRGQFEQFMIAITEMLISTHTICTMVGDVNMAVFHQISRHHYDAMNRLNIDTSNVRMRERVLYLARTLTIRMAIYWLFFQPLAKYRLKKRFDLYEFATDVEMLLVCTEEITNFAFELAASQFIDPNVDPVISCVAQMTNFCRKETNQNTDEPQYLRTATNQELSTPGQYRQNSTQTVIYTPGKTQFARTEQRSSTDETVRVMVEDYNYIQIEGTLNDVADNIAAQIAHKTVALAAPDIRSVLRSLARIRYKAFSRRKFNEATDTFQGEEMPKFIETNKEELFAAVKINQFEKNVQVHCGFMANVIDLKGRNLIEEIIDKYQHPKQSRYDTVSITSIPDYPNLLPRRRVRPNTMQEYKQNKRNFLSSFNPNALDRTLLAQRGLLHSNPTEWRLYYEAFERRYIEYTRFSPETEVIAWHLTMCAHNPTEKRCLRAFPEGQRALQRVASFAKQLLDADRQKAIECHSQGIQYTPKYQTARQAAVEAQTSELDNKIEFTPTYPLYDIIDRTKVLIQMVSQRSDDPTAAIARIKHSFEEAVTRSGMRVLYSNEELAELEPSFVPQIMDYASNPQSSFDAVLFRSSAEIEGSSNNLMLKRRRDNNDEQQEFYGCITKQPHLLTQAIDMEVQEAQARSNEQQQLREQALQAMEETFEPEEETTTEDLLAAFRNVQPLEEPHDLPGPLGMQMRDLMTQGMEMVSF